LKDGSKPAQPLRRTSRRSPQFPARACGSRPEGAGGSSPGVSWGPPGHHGLSVQGRVIDVAPDPPGTGRGAADHPGSTQSSRGDVVTIAEQQQAGLAAARAAAARCPRRPPARPAKSMTRNGTPGPPTARTASALSSVDPFVADDDLPTGPGRSAGPVRPVAQPDAASRLRTGITTLTSMINGGRRPDLHRPPWAPPFSPRPMYAQ